MEQYVPNVKRLYKEKVAKELFEEFGYKSTMEIPGIEKVSINVGVGDAISNKKFLESAVRELELISGQHVVKTKARKSISNFKLREGQEIGAKVTLRGNQMWEFLDRLMNVAIARIKDFRGINPNAFDGHGNFSMGITEQIIFPEIDYDRIDSIRGMDITITTTARNDEQGKALLEAFNFPFKK